MLKDDNGSLRQFGEFRLDTAKMVLWHDGKVVSLPLKAIELLCTLVENHGEVVTKNALMEKVWGEAFVEDSVLTQNIYLLRKTLLEIGGAKHLIQNIPRRGYLFRGEVGEAADASSCELVIERHLFERVQLEETSRPESSEAITIETTTQPKPLLERTPVVRPRVYLGAALITFLLIAAGATFYFRNTTRQADSAKVKTRVVLPVKGFSQSAATKSLAVLRLKSADENLAQVFTSDLTSRLGSLNKFAVKPFALMLKHEETGAVLQADFVLDGAIWAKNNRIHVEARLLDAKSNGEVWSKTFDDTDIIRLQDAIANQTAQAILKQLTPAEREQIAKRLPTNIPAYETYQNGYLLWRKRGDGVTQSVSYFQKAIELDANFARAYVGRASAKAMLGVKDSPAAREAEELLKKAYAIDENLAEAYAVQGFMQIFHHWDWENAEISLRHALELDPHSINAHHWLGVYYSIHRRLDEAKAEMQQALELDPTSPTLLADMGQLHYFAGERGKAIEYYEKALALERNHSFATRYLNEINQPQGFGDKEDTLKQLSRAADAHAFTLPYINVDPRYDSLRADPRYQAILKNMGLAGS